MEETSSSQKSSAARGVAIDATPLNEALLGQLFDNAVARSGAFGAQLSIIKGDQQLDFAAGFAHARRGIRLQIDTLMQIGSVTKIFNAAMILALVERGVLHLDAPVRCYLTDFKVADSEAVESLTLRHLLSMSSGMDNGPYAYFGGGDDALDKYVAQLASLPQHFSPGAHFGYSNAGTCIAGCVASRVTGKPWEILLRETLIEPAALSRSALLEADVLYSLVSAGHFARPSGQVNIVDPQFTMARSRAPSGSTLALSTAHLARFARMFVNDGVADTGAAILSSSSVQKLMQPQVNVPSLKYGNAWCLGPYKSLWDGVEVWGHGGTSLTSTSFLHWVPKLKGVIAFVVNTHAAMAELAAVALGEIMQAAFGISKPRLELASVSKAPLDPHRYVGVYEELGMRLQVSPRDAGTLSAVMVPKSAEYKLGIGQEQTAVLVPLGGDRFLVNPSGGASGHRGPVDMAFFGNDGEGRASHVLNLVFPMSRIANPLPTVHVS